MKKRILSILLALCLVLTLLPSVALAGDPFTRLVDLDGTSHLLFKDYGRDGSADDSGPGWSWDGKNCILTLNGYTGKSIGSDNISKLVLAGGSVNRLNSMSLSGYTDMNGVELPVTIEGTGELIIYNTEVDRYGTKERIPAFQIGRSTPLLFGGNLEMTGGTNEGDSSPLVFAEHEEDYVGYPRVCRYATTSAGEKAYYVRIASSSSNQVSSSPVTASPQPATTEKPTTSTGFADVADNAWYYEAVEYVNKPVYDGYNYGLMDGITATEFSPNTNADRATIVTALCRRFNFDIEGNPHYDKAFSDVPEKLGAVVGWAVSSGVVTGYGNGRFGPNDPVTREQFAVMLYRYVQSKNDWRDATVRADLSVYSDQSQISDWAVEAMSWANASGYITGTTSTTLNPKGNITRAEVAMILMRLC